MKTTKLIPGHFYSFNDRGEVHIGQYIGRQRGFECCVCGKGANAYTFNLWNSERDYETWGYGPAHMPCIWEDFGEPKDDGVIIDRYYN